MPELWPSPELGKPRGAQSPQAGGAAGSCPPWVPKASVGKGNDATELQGWPSLQYLRRGRPGGEEVSLEEGAAAGPGRMAGFGVVSGTRQGDAGAAGGGVGGGKGGQWVDSAPLGVLWQGLAWTLEPLGSRFSLAVPSLAVYPGQVA